MSSAALNECQLALFTRIERFEFDEGGESLTFARRLARENGWTIEYTKRVLKEYKRFMFLAVVADHPVTPSDQVDQAWHLHLTYTRSYWERFCREVLSKAVHHGPTKGGAAEGEKFHAWYENTKRSYQEFFAEPPPADIWPGAETRFGEDLHYQRVNLRRHWLISKPKCQHSGNLAAAVALPLSLGVGGASLFGKIEHKDLFLIFAVLASVSLLFFVLSSKSRGRDGGEGGGCTGMFWGGDDNDAGGCGDAGCGGGGCGGCGD